MADVVRTGAIFRVKNPATMRSPMPRLLARGRIASATPEPSRKRSALEAVAPTVSDAGLLASFNRLVSESETRHAAKRAGGGTTRSRRVVAKRVQEAEEDEEEEDEEEEDDDDDEEEEQEEPPPRKPAARKRPRQEPEEEPTDEEKEEEEGEIEEESTGDEMVTPQRPQPEEEEDLDDDDDDNDDNDSDGVTVQKRLMYEDTPPAKSKPVPKSTKAVRPPLIKKAKSAPPPPPPARKAPTTQLKKKGVAVASSGGGGLELLSLSSAATPSRSTRIRTGVLLMSEWFPDWPPTFVGDQLQLLLRGQVLGQSMAFTVQRRVTDAQFVSSDNQNVRLYGCMDIERARDADVPPMVMEILVEGIPTNWRQLLEIYAPPPDPRITLSVTAKDKAMRRKAKAATEADHKASVPIPGVTKPPTKPTKLTPATSALNPTTPNVEKRSRSGRVLTPVMEWWRNERKIMDANFASKIVKGSPAYLPSKRTSAVKSEATLAARQKIQEIYDAQRKSAEWSEEQLVALQDAKVQVPTTHANFWGEVAKLVSGKSADECRARSYDDLPVAPSRKTVTAGAAARATATGKQQPSTQVPAKIHRAGSNLFKKQVRQFVRDQEQKNVDDLFSLATPSKAAFAGTSGLDDLKSPDAPQQDAHQRDGDESDDDGLLSGAGRELLEKVPLSKRDDVDSYVRTLKRGNETLGLKGVRLNKAVAPGFTTPPAKKKPRREGVHMVAEVGTHVIQGTVTPGGTTRLRIDKDSDDEDHLAEDEENEEAALSDAY